MAQKYINKLWLFKLSSYYLKYIIYVTSDAYMHMSNCAIIKYKQHINQNCPTLPNEKLIQEVV